MFTCHLARQPWQRRGVAGAHRRSQRPLRPPREPPGSARLRRRRTTLITALSLHFPAQSFNSPVTDFAALRREGILLCDDRLRS